MKTERMTILLSADEKAAIASRAKQLKLSAGEVVRRAVEVYQPTDDSEAVLNGLADELRKAAKEARRAMIDARRELDETLRYFSSKREPKQDLAMAPGRSAA